jgi:hypothetical protein
VSELLRHGGAPASLDRAQTVEIEGTLVAVKWQNPHTQL